MNNTQKWITITAWLDLIYFFLIPYLMLKNGTNWQMAIVAGICLGAFQPSATSYHELHHKKLKMKWFEKIPFYLSMSYYFLCVADVIHSRFHHKYANTEKDITHPTIKTSYYESVFKYYFKSFPMIFSIEPFKIFLSFFGFILMAIFQYKVFGMSGLMFQVFTMLAHHWTVSAGNYCQHWGLELLPIPNNEKAKYAWDNKGEFARYSFFNFHRHSGHHANAGKPTQEIGDNKNMIRNPYPLPLMMFICFFPKTFKRISRPKLNEFLMRFVK